MTFPILDALRPVQDHPPEPAHEWHTVAEAAIARGVSRRTIRRQCELYGRLLGFAVLVRRSRGRPMYYLRRDFDLAKVLDRDEPVKSPKSFDDWINLPTWSRRDARRRFKLARQWDHRRQAARATGEPIGDATLAYLDELGDAGVEVGGKGSAVGEDKLRMWHLVVERNKPLVALIKLARTKPDEGLHAEGVTDAA
ncbi:MAG: hypothetical protein AAF561_05455 [Planctomycetota bacterium]